jgi:hypothetical protein
MPYCNCPNFCKGGKQVTEKTYRDHASYQPSKLSDAFNEFIANETASCLGTHNPHATSASSNQNNANDPEEGPYHKRKRAGGDNGAAQNATNVNSNFEDVNVGTFVMFSPEHTLFL